MLEVRRSLLMKFYSNYSGGAYPLCDTQDMTTDERVTTLEAENAALRAENESLHQQVAQVAARLHELETQRATDSHTSSKPPSSDGWGRKLFGLRPQRGKKPGGQPGQRGHTLRLGDPPDRLVIHRPTCCAHCQPALDLLPAARSERPQGQDIPRRRLEVTEHRAEQVRCPACGQTTQAAFPSTVAAVVHYGPRLGALARYLLDGQLVPYARTCQLLADLLGCSFSVGTLARLVAQGARRLESQEAQIKTWLHHAAVIGNDETSLFVGSRRGWLHASSTPALTHYGLHAKGGSAGTDALGILPGYLGTSVHDSWCAYGTYACRHALCQAHQLRELTFWEEQEQQPWAADLKALLLEMHQAVQAAKAADQPHLAPEARSAYWARYHCLLAAGWAANPVLPSTGPPRRGRPKPSKAQNLLARFAQQEAAVFAFVDDFAVPFTNNQTERDIRLVKVQQKISGTFRTEPGAAAFCRLRGYLSTVRKQGHALLEPLVALCAGHPLPALSPT